MKIVAYAGKAFKIYWERFETEATLSLLRNASKLTLFVVEYFSKLYA